MGPKCSAVAAAPTRALGSAGPALHRSAVIEDVRSGVVAKPVHVLSDVGCRPLQSELYGNGRWPTEVMPVLVRRCNRSEREREGPGGATSKFRVILGGMNVTDEREREGQCNRCNKKKCVACMPSSQLPGGMRMAGRQRLFQIKQRVGDRLHVCTASIAVLSWCYRGRAEKVGVVPKGQTGHRRGMQPAACTHDAHSSWSEREMTYKMTFPVQAFLGVCQL